MRLDRFDLNLLVVLDALLEMRNVTKASERLHIGQSAASAALARLRDYFGDELLVPVGRQLMLTPLAESLTVPVRDTLLRARATIALKPGFDPAEGARQFEVCASDYVTTVLLSDVVRRLATQAPRVGLDIYSPPKMVLDVFERGGIDLLVMPQQYTTKLDHPQQTLFTDRQVCVVSADHPEVGEQLDFEQYMALGHVAICLGDDRTVAFEDWFLPRFGRQRRIELSVDNFSTMCLLIAGTRRVATMHRRLAEHFARYLPLRLIDPPFEMPTLVEQMVWPRYLDQDPAHQWLRAQLMAGAQALAD